MQNNELAAQELSAANPQKHSKQKLERGLSNRNIQLIALGGAIGTGLFMGSGKSIHLAGPSILLVYAIIGIVIFLIMRAMGEVLLHNLSYKSFQDFAGHLLGPFAGFLTGWSYWVLWVLIAIGDMVVVTGYFDFWIQNTTISAICTVALLIALLISNLLTVKLFGEIEFWFALIKIVAILALILVGGAMVATGFAGSNGVAASFTYLWSHGGFFPTGATGFLAAFPIAIYSFIGTELIGTTAAETQDPQTTIPRAINAVPMRIVFFYVLSLAIIMSITPWDQIDPQQSPFVNVFNLAGLVAAASVMNFVVLTSASSSANSGIYSSSRMLYALGLTRLASRKFGRLGKHRVPSRALALSGGLIFLFVPLLWLGGSVMDAFALVMDAASTLILGIWALIVLAYLKYRKVYPQAHAASSYKMPGSSWTPYLCLAFIIFIGALLTIDPNTRAAFLLTPIWFMILGVAWMFRKNADTELAAASSKADPHRIDEA
ncbi:amino acid permease [Arcanobacterium hippocoleae]|uniref:D-serine/D-alanine/glycine transporter n=1 Tax=Arcanobacterium hippocoleae TaxID=149017 RepID=A0ABU1T172_9ACTO|nr:amino acid permease [Arcanobacterium hippocoleae]MDR6938596.1 D-serine/D-alanine/glycine transporter [Arcanobacterium hippocoleae]